MISGTVSQRAPPSSSNNMYMPVHCGDGNLVEADMKPTVETTDVAVQLWTPSKRLILSPAKMLPHTPTAVKSEVHTSENYFLKSCSCNLYI